MIANKYDGKVFSVDYLEKAIASIQQSTLGQKSEAAFDGIFDAMDLKDKDLGKFPTAQNRLQKLSTASTTSNFRMMTHNLTFSERLI